MRRHAFAWFMILGIGVTGWFTGFILTYGLRG
jgi:hypothetical protein